MLWFRSITTAMFLILAVPGCGSSKDSRPKPTTEPTATPIATPTATNNVFPRLFRDKISQVVVSWGKYTIAIDRGSPHWRVTTPYNDRVDPAMVEAVLRELERLELGHQPVAKTSGAWASYTLGPAEVVSLRVTHDGKKLPALHIGAKKYARIGDNPDVYTRLNMNRYTWSRPPSEWRDRKVMHFDADAATGLEAVDARGRRVFAKRIAAPPAANHKLARAQDTWTLSKGKKIVG